MDEAEIQDRMKKNLEYCDKVSTVQWAATVLQDLKQVAKSKDTSAYSTLGFGMKFRLMDVKAGFHELDLVQVTKDFRLARNRLILLDWGGTLVAENDVNDKLQAYAFAIGQANRSGPSEELKIILESLCGDPRNIVYVVSGKKAKGVSDFFGGVKGLGLAAEHGSYYRYPSETRLELRSARNQWKTMIQLESLHWKDAARVVMDMYVQRTQGTYIEEKSSAIIWQFRDADPEFGFLQSKELEEHLNEVLSGEPVDVMRGGGISDGYIEVRAHGVSKGYFLEHLLTVLQSKGISVDFVMAVGDDASDEPMFEQINTIRQSSAKEKIKYLYSVAVGKKPTAADAYVNDTSSVMELLSCLVKSAAYEKRYHSVVDLPSHDIGSNSNMRPLRFTMGSPATNLTVSIKQI
jgi:trehalose 6-phosphate synthase/phosphatase